MDVTGVATEVLGTLVPSGAGYAIRVGVPGTGTRSLVAFAPGGTLSPGVAANEPSAWHAYGGADLVVIAYRDFMGSLTPLKSLREHQGLSVALVDVEDVYDEYSFGVKSPYALKAFMANAHTWRRRPAYLLLVGDASFDPRNYLGFGSFDFVPTKLVDATWLETASDDWFTDLDNDLVPDIPVGRLPVRSAESASLVVGKITGYSQARQGTTALLVADQADDAFDFPSAMEAIGELLPARIAVTSLSRGTADDQTLSSEIVSALDQGPLLVNYAGHGSEEVWDGSILTSTLATGLTNGPLPLVLAMTCLNGLFQDVYAESLAKALILAPRGGAVAAWASSGLTEAGPQAVMNREFVRLLFSGAHLTVGQAIVPAKQATTDPDVRKTWIFFGDPSMRVPSTQR